MRFFIFPMARVSASFILLKSDGVKIESFLEDLFSVFVSEEMPLSAKATFFGLSSLTIESVFSEMCMTPPSLDNCFWCNSGIGVVF